MLNISLATGRGTISQNHECWGVFLQCKIADNDCYISSLFWPITLPSTCWFFPHRKETAGSLQRWSIGKKWAVQRFSWYIFCKFRFVFQCLSFVSWHLYCMYFVFVLYLSTYIVCAGKKWASTVVLLQPPFCTTNDIRPHVHSFLISYGNQFSPDSSGNTYRNIAEVEYDCLKTKEGSDFLWYHCWIISFLWKQGPYNCWVELWYDLHWPSIKGFDILKQMEYLKNAQVVPDEPAVWRNCANFLCCSFLPLSRLLLPPFHSGFGDLSEKQKQI